MTDPSADPRWATVRPLAARWNEQQRAKLRRAGSNPAERTVMRRNSWRAGARFDRSHPSSEHVRSSRPRRPIATFAKKRSTGC